MAFTKTELGEIEETVGALCRRHTPPKFKDELSIEYRVQRHDVTIVERRPHWNGKPGFTERGFAKFRFTRGTKQWRLLWMRADLKWHAYKVDGNKSRLAQLVAEVDRDQWGCFFGWGAAEPWLKGSTEQPTPGVVVSAWQTFARVCPKPRSSRRADSISRSRSTRRSSPTTAATIMATA